MNPLFVGIIWMFNLNAIHFYLFFCLILFLLCNYKITCFMKSFHVFQKTMRFMCDIEICNRCLPSYNMKSSGRSSRGYLSIGQKPGSTNKNRTVFISFSTAKDKSGTQYLVSFYFCMILIYSCISLFLFVKFKKFFISTCSFFFWLMMSVFSVHFQLVFLSFIFVAFIPTVMTKQHSVAIKKLLAR